jgi:hypothetical protein
MGQKGWTSLLTNKVANQYGLDSMDCAETRNMALHAADPGVALEYGLKNRPVFVKKTNEWDRLGFRKSAGLIVLDQF